jgi:hypothetical protein
MKEDKGAESGQLTKLLCTTCGPPVEKRRLAALRFFAFLWLLDSAFEAL